MPPTPQEQTSNAQQEGRARLRYDNWRHGHVDHARSHERQTRHKRKRIGRDEYFSNVGIKYC